MDLREVERGYGLDLSSSGCRLIAGSCEYGNEHSVCTNVRIS
jgi:hypothetical protein